MTQKRVEKNLDGCLSVILNLFGIQPKQAAVPLPYKVRESLLTPAELRFHTALTQAVEGRAAIYPKVGLQDVFSITDREGYRAARNRISTRHVDFLICELGTLKPLFGVELDDSSHNRTETQRHDLFKNQVFEMGHLALVRVTARQQYNVDELKNALQEFFPKEAGTQTPPLCPNCKIPMVRRTARQGEHKGQEFWACPNFPTCKELINIESIAG